MHQTVQQVCCCPSKSVSPRMRLVNSTFKRIRARLVEEIKSATEATGEERILAHASAVTGSRRCLKFVCFAQKFADLLVRQLRKHFIPEPHRKTANMVELVAKPSSTRIISRTSNLWTGSIASDRSLASSKLPHFCSCHR